MWYENLTKRELIYTLVTRDFIVDNCHAENIQLKNQLILTEKALELACEKCLSFPCSDYCSSNDDCEDCYYKREFTPENFKNQAKEKMKSEQRK